MYHVTEENRDLGRKVYDPFDTIEEARARARMLVREWEWDGFITSQVSPDEWRVLSSIPDPDPNIVRVEVLARVST